MAMAKKVYCFLKFIIHHFSWRGGEFVKFVSRLDYLEQLMNNNSPFFL